MPNTPSVRSSVVNLLIVANVAIFILQMKFGGFMLKNFALWPLGEYPIMGGNGSVGFEFWQLFTSAFLHSPDNFAHIALNMYGLWAFGRVVENTLGSRRFLWLYFASVLFSGVVQLIYVSLMAHEEVVPTIGASGGVFGVLLAFAMLFPHQRVMLIIPPIPMKAWVMVIVYGAIELFSGVVGTMQGVAHFAHLGGMLGALLLMLMWRRRFPPAPPELPVDRSRSN
jgi:membrane associated rhomboid family serine protease